jgi:hypothetical protein
MADPFSFENGTAFQASTYAGVVWQITLFGGPPNGLPLSRRERWERLPKWQ